MPKNVIVTTSFTPTEPPPPPPAPPPSLANVTLDDASTLAVRGGRVTTFELADDTGVTAVEVTSQPVVGRCTVNPDNTIALVLSTTPSSVGDTSFNYTVTGGANAGSYTQPINIIPSLQLRGWGLGDHYMLEADENDFLVVEPGQTHRKVYVTAGSHGLTAAEIAVIEGVSVDTITTSWLIANPEYGGSESMPLEHVLGVTLYRSLVNAGASGSSHWLLYERGYDYSETGLTIFEVSRFGETPLHPMHVTSWGVGTKPIINAGKIRPNMRNLVVSDIIATSFGMDTGSEGLNENFIVSHVNSNAGWGIGDAATISKRFTIRYSDIADATSSAAPTEEGVKWPNRTQGIFAPSVEGFLMDNFIVSHCGWADDYQWDGMLPGGQPPSSHSQNIYFQYNTYDVTFRDSMTTLAPSAGSQFRGGAFTDGAVYTDNNTNISNNGGNYKKFSDATAPVYIGDYTLVMDAITTCAGYKKVQTSGGANSWGNRNEGNETSWVNNLVCHLANPDDAAEQAWKELARSGLQPAAVNGSSDLDLPGSVLFDNTVVYNWQGSTSTDALSVNKNTDGVTPAVADVTTINRWAASELGLPVSAAATGEQVTDTDGIDTHYKTALWREYTNVLLAERAQNIFRPVRDLIHYFQDGFNIDKGGDGSSTSHRFIPSALGDGVRWDNKLNWSNTERPTAGDAVDLGGNYTISHGTLTLGSLALGQGGTCAVWTGRLDPGTLTAGSTGGHIETRVAGQFWLNGYTGANLITVSLNGGRFANYGDMTGALSVTAQGQCEVIFATGGGQFDMVDVEIIGTDPRVGFDGDQGTTAAIIMDSASNLTFRAGATGVATIKEFKSGAYGDAPDVASAFTCAGDLVVDLSDYTAGAGTLQLVNADTVTGSFASSTATNVPGGLTPTFNVTGTAVTLTLA